ncbi:MAG: transposase [Eubacteriaceae bacterium]|nr:transposase [Eubacteriaceae bacterium]
MIPFEQNALCMRCSQKELAMSERAYICEKCGSEMDRDMNATINIREEAKRIFGLA